MKISFEVWGNMPWGRLEAAGPAWNSWGDLPSDEVAGKVAGYGYDAVDYMYGHLLNGGKAALPERLAATKRAAADAGIEIGYVANHVTFVSPREQDRERGIQGFKDAIDAAAELGAKSVCTLLGDGYYDPPLNVLMSRRDAWAQAREAITEVCDYAAPKGVNVSIELLQGTILNKVESVEKMFGQVDRSNLRLTFDTGAFYVAVKPFMSVPTAVKRLSPFIDIVQIKDEVGLPTIVNCNHIWFGGGLVDFAETLQVLEDIDFDGYVSVEWEGWQVGGQIGVGEPAGIGMSNFDRVAEESLEFLREYGFRTARERA